MNILKRQVSLPASISVIAITAVFALIPVVRAFQSTGDAPANVFESGSNVTINQTIEAPESDDELGSMASPWSPYHFESINGVETYYERSTYASATNTPCALQSPAATSTLEYASASFTQLASTSAGVYQFAVAATPYATTTAVEMVFTLPASNKGTYTASSTAGAYLHSRLVAPNQYLVLGAQYDGGADAHGIVSLTGVCQGVFRLTK